MTESVKLVDKDGTTWWKLPDGRRHREDGPAIEYLDGHQAWYINGECHREGGPAIIRPDKTTWWYRHGRIHREDGPAVEWADGTKQWCINDIEIENLSQITPELELKYPEFCRSFTIFHILNQ